MVGLLVGVSCRALRVAVNCSRTWSDRNPAGGGGRDRHRRCARSELSGHLSDERCGVRAFCTDDQPCACQAGGCRVTEPAKLGWWPVVARLDHRAGSDAVPPNREGGRAMDTTKLLRRLTTTAVAAAVAVVAMSPSVNAVAVGVGYHDPAPGGAALDKAAATAIDVAIIAETFGWTPEATRRHMEDQEAFGALQDEVQTRFGTTFAGAEHAESPGGRSWIRFKGDVPAAARALASASGLDVGLTGGRRFSAAELTRRAVDVVRLLADAGHRPVSAEVSPSGVIEVAASGPRRPGAVLPP